MNLPDENLSQNNPRGINVIALWLLVSVLPGAYWSYHMGDKLAFSRLTSVVWAYMAVAFLCSMGLFFKREWARKGAVWLFSILFLWGVVVIHWLLGPSIQPLAFWLMNYVPLPQTTIQNILFTLFVFFILWPVIVIFYLTYPGIKIVFQNRRKKEKKKKPKDKK